MSPQPYRNTVAVVTGGASGIGAALGRSLAQKGARVVLADRQGDALAETVDQIRSTGASADAAVLDVRDAGAFESFAEDTFTRLERVDYFFNNAGIAIGGEVRTHSIDDWRYIVDVNVLGVMYGIHAFYPRMVRQGSGHIINTGSIAGLLPSPLTAAYAASKHGVVGLSRSLRIEAQSHGVRVTALCPGAVRTPILIDAGRYGKVTQPMPRAAQQRFWNRLRPIEATEFAERVLSRLPQNPAILVEPLHWRLLCWLDRLLPAAFERLAARNYHATLADFERSMPAGESRRDANLSTSL